MNISLGFSPCPNDTFIFYALMNGRVYTNGFHFTEIIADVETLNQKALKAEIDVTKLSIAAYLYVNENYVLLNSGSALGRGCGPLLIAKREIKPSEVSNSSVAIPGKLTTANFLFNAFFPVHGKKTEMVFSDIEEAVLSEQADLGVIIHENRFTYQKKGLKKVADLGQMWEERTGQPIPLGGIAMKRTFDSPQIDVMNAMIRESVLYAFAHPDETMEFVRKHAQEMDEAVMLQHIRLYVNEYTIDLGPSAEKPFSSSLIMRMNKKSFREKIMTTRASPLLYHS
jgi:1,4-dihydroxy-6-naphthoate synthase